MEKGNKNYNFNNYEELIADILGLSILMSGSRIAFTKLGHLYHIRNFNIIFNVN